MAPQGIIIGALREIIVYTTQKEGAISVKTAHKRREPIDLTQGPCWKVILLFSLPVILSYLLQQVYSISDAAIVGQTLTAAEVAGVNDTNSLVFIFLQFAFGVSAGFCVITSYYVGMHDERGVRRSLATQLLLSAALTVNDDDEVLIADPSYPCNRELVRAFGGKVVDVPTSAATRFHLTPELCKEYWTDRTKAVMITSPSNPTGTTIAFDTLKAVCDLARERGAWRIVDETYLDLADREPDGSDVKSVLACDPDAIVCSSFSKFFGMTGWRLGWMVVPEYALEAMDDLATNFFLCAHTPTQHAALACFTPETLAVCEERRQELLERRRIVVDGLAEIGLPLEVEPNGAFYAYFNISSTGLDAWTFCERALKEAHIALTPGRDFGEATADTHVRLSYAASREALREGLKRLGDFVAKVRG